MDFLINDLSIHSQFVTDDDFEKAVDSIMTIRSEIRQKGSVFYCHRNVLNANISSNKVMQQVIQRWSNNKKRAWLLWLTNGPFWQDNSKHGEDDYLSVDGNIVTGNGIGEAAVRVSDGIESSLVSFSPSNWEKNPILVTWNRNDSSSEDIEVGNFWEIGEIQDFLKDIPISTTSWNGLEEITRKENSHLCFSEDAFTHLEGQPFVATTANQIFRLLDILNKLKSHVDKEGSFGIEGNELLKKHFTGQKAWFTPSSQDEQDNKKFKQAMTFKDPCNPGKTIFCHWHGKENHRKFRVHFSWPIKPNTPLHIVYIGPKITKR